MFNKHINNGRQSHSTDPVSASPQSAKYDPEFLDAKGIEAIFGLKRSLCYELFKTSKIQAVSLRGRGRTRGKRLFVVDSVREYLTSQIEEVNHDNS